MFCDLLKYREMTWRTSRVVRLDSKFEHYKTPLELGMLSDDR